MRKYSLSLMIIGLMGSALPAAAADMMISAMQSCTTNEDCQLISNSCADNCAYVPVSKSNLPAIGQQYQARCGKPMDANPTCVMNPSLNAACINSRCTIDYAYANNAGAKDYQSGGAAMGSGSAKQ